MEWAEAPVLSEIEPLLGVREARSAEFNRSRSELLETKSNRHFFADELRQTSGAVAHLNSVRLYGELAGMKANLYKNLIVRAWGILADSGIAGLLHPEGVYDDASGERFRAAIYPRLKAHYGHKNEMQLFADVDHHTGYSINIYGGKAIAVGFRHMSNLYNPQTIAASLAHDK